mgnify:CR=1 FL=1
MAAHPLARGVQLTVERRRLGQAHRARDAAPETGLSDTRRTREAQDRASVLLLELAHREELEDSDLLEMVNAGLIGVTIADDYLAQFQLD